MSTSGTHAAVSSSLSANGRAATSVAAALSAGAHGRWSCWPPLATALRGVLGQLSLSDVLLLFLIVSFEFVSVV